MVQELIRYGFGVLFIIILLQENFKFYWKKNQIKMVLSLFVSMSTVGVAIVDGPDVQLLKDF